MVEKAALKRSQVSDGLKHPAVVVDKKETDPHCDHCSAGKLFWGPGGGDR
jgi:hypothetical protein